MYRCVPTSPHSSRARPGVRNVHGAALRRPVPGGKTPGTSKKQYRQVKGVRYDDGALAIADDADKISAGRQSHLREVQDGGVVTPTEWRTLSYIADGGGRAQYALTAPARKYLLDLVRAEEGGGEEEEDRDGNSDSK